MKEPRGARELQRLKWVTVLLPVAFIWAFELVRFFVLEPSYRSDTAHVVSALLMGVAVVGFATVVSLYLDRTQHEMVAQNRDLGVTHEVSTAVRGGQPLPQLLDRSLARLIAETGALAGVVTIADTGREAIRVVRPTRLDDGLAWLEPLLAEPADPGVLEPHFDRRPEVDTGVLDLPLARGGQRVGHLRLVFHPPVEPDVSQAALADIAGEIAGAAQLGLVVADLHRRERERAALYGVALQLTGRADLREVLDTIAGHARELLAAERAVVCLDSGRAGTLAGGGGRLATTDNGSICVVAHRTGDVHHRQNTDCLVVRHGDGAAWAARPLRGPDGLLGDLCVIRAGRPLGEAEMTLLGALADMAAIAVRTAQLREAEEQWTIVSERDRIARELHDSLAQVLGLIHLRLRALETKARDEASDALGQELSDLADTADEAYRDVREAILGLRETISADTGLEGALREYLRKYSRQTGIAATLVCEGQTKGALAPGSEVQLLRVVQEALTNVRKHAQARRVVVRLDCSRPTTILSVEDDGVGFDPSRVVSSFDGGFGLASMRERVEQVGGTLDVHTAPGEGTRIMVHLDAGELRDTPSSAPTGAAG